jgi:hypothetical protein
MIRAEYKEQLQKYRKQDAGWGGSAIRNAGDHIARYINRHEAIVSVLDFGCGMGVLKEFIATRVPRPLDWYEYDPSIEGKDTVPRGNFDLILTVDVMEHIEPISLESTLGWIADHSTRQFHHIDCNDTNHMLDDGRDVHLIVKPPAWWVAQLTAQVGGGFSLTERHVHDKLKRGRVRQSCTLILEKNRA